MAERSKKFRSLFREPPRCNGKIRRSRHNYCRTWSGLVRGDTHRYFSCDRIACLLRFEFDWFSVDLRNEMRRTRIRRNRRCPPEIFFLALIRGNESVEGPTLFSESELKGKLETIEIAVPVFTSDSLPQFKRAVLRFPSALMLARLAREPHRSFSLPPLEPIYLREPHITMPK